MMIQMECPVCRTPYLPGPGNVKCSRCGYALPLNNGSSSANISSASNKTQLGLNSGLYTRRITRQFPGMFVILLDQSSSMSDPVEDQDLEFMKAFNPDSKPISKADIATAALNIIIYRMAQEANYDEKTGKRKKSAYLTVLGYNHDVTPLITRSPGSNEPISIATLAEHPLDIVKTEIITKDNRIGMRKRIHNQPYWLTPRAEGTTHMAQAFKSAKDVVETWLASSPELISAELGLQRPRNECFPPVIVNITDAQNTGSDNPLDVANDIRQLGTSDGQVLIFNCHFSVHQGHSTVFPSDRSEVSRLDDYGLAEKMFEMSSPIPEELRKDTNKAKTILGREVAAGARCYVYNADPQTLIQFLEWGTLQRVGTNPRIWRA